MKHDKPPYRDLSWIKNKILNGVTAGEIAKEVDATVSTISKYYSKVINSMTMNEILGLIKSHPTVNGIFSPRSKAYNKIVNMTDFLPTKTPIKQRYWHLINSKNTPKCKMCEKKVGWEKDLQTYRIYCSGDCQGRDPDIIKKREETNLHRRGVKYWNQSHIPKESLALLSNKEWLREQHKIKKKSLMSIGRELDVHPLLPAQYLNRYGISGEQTSTAQTNLVDFIKTLYNGEIIENSRKIISPLEIDIYIPEMELAIEYNGIYWHSELAGKNKDYHINKTISCNNKNIRLIHIFENEWVEKNEITKSRLRYILNKTENIIYARKCKICDVPKQEARKFLEINHIQGGCLSKINIGLYYKDRLVAMMSLDKSRFTKKYEYELIRYCNSLDTTVVGGASKLFSSFVKCKNPNSVISYSDKRWNTGNLYKQLNFNHSHDSKPNYWYFKNNSLLLHSRIKFQKHKLHKILDIFDENLTEWENMTNNKFNRIWDCGNSAWVWTT